jgi:hypothetical protein
LGFTSYQKQNLWFVTCQIEYPPPVFVRIEFLPGYQSGYQQITYQFVADFKNNNCPALN